MLAPSLHNEANGALHICTLYGAMRLNLWHRAMSQDRYVLRVRIHHDVRVMSYDNHLSIRLNPFECCDYEVIDEFVVQIIFRLVKEERVIAELENNCKECGFNGQTHDRLRGTARGPYAYGAISHVSLCSSGAAPVVRRLR